METNCRTSLESLQMSLKKNESDREHIQLQEKKCRTALDNYRGPDGAQ
jgi:hypothetical protein